MSWVVCSASPRRLRAPRRLQALSALPICVRLVRRRVEGAASMVLSAGAGAGGGSEMVGVAVGLVAGAGGAAAKALAGSASKPWPTSCSLVICLWKGILKAKAGSQAPAASHRTRSPVDARRRGVAVPCIDFLLERSDRETARRQSDAGERQKR